MDFLSCSPFFLVFLTLCFFYLNSQSVLSLSTVAISETSNRTLVCALTFVPPQQSLLNCTSFPGGISVISLDLTGVNYSAVVGGNGFICGLTSSLSRMFCWRFSANDTKRIYDGPPLRELASGNTHICGVVEGTNQLECWQWRRFNLGNEQIFSSVAVGESFVCGLSEFGQIHCYGDGNHIGDILNVPAGNYSVVAAGFRHACALSFNGTLECWGDKNMIGEKPSGQFTSLALGENRGCALTTKQKLICWGQGNFSLPATHRETFFLGVTANRNAFCGILAGDSSLQCWGNENLDTRNTTVFNDVVPGPCRKECHCGVLSNYEKYCSNGLMICQACIRKNPREIPPLTPPPPPEPVTSNGGRWSRKLVAFLVVGCIGSLSLLILSVILFFRYCKLRGCRIHDSGRIDEAPQPLPTVELQRGTSQSQQEKRFSHLLSLGTGGHLEEFVLDDLLHATNNFDDDHKIGTGSFGSVYQATLEDGREVAVKRAEASSSSSLAYAFAGGGTKRQEDKEKAFLNELEFLSLLNHKNLVRLLGFCVDSNERVLVYEYMNNGNLHEHLHKRRSSSLMTWPARIKVALDAARGIEYLHVYAVPSIIHRDIKSSNILLDDTCSAKVSDFGLSLMGPPDEESHLSLRAAGTVGYMDPEYYRLQQLTTKSDVYSFGVVLLELLSGRKAIHYNENGTPRNVVDFVVPYIIQDEIHRVLDKRLPPPTPFEIEAVAYVGYVAADCVMQEGKDRPTMTEIVNSLERALTACLAPPPLSRSTTGSST